VCTGRSSGRRRSPSAPWRAYGWRGRRQERGDDRSGIEHCSDRKTGCEGPLGHLPRRQSLMALFQGVMLLIFGYGMLGVVYQSLTKGWLPFGANGFKGRLEVRMDERPFGYWTAFTLYCAFGVWCVFIAFSVLSGQTEPLPLT